MKSKKHAITRSKSKTHRKTRTHTRTKTKTGTRVVQPVKVDTSPRVSSEASIKVKSCQEVEVGDIGGFGSPDELEEHEKRCGEPATELCTTCGKNLCRTHYDLLHRDHDTSSGQTGSRGLAQQ
ncbi:hypothetical protein AUG19_09600 [archaeon 13_1_20CM_2_54_9]|nr:MAG: hypothetical protein AUJ07_02260 [Crenarchaeota archaeon 13_1_40CM_3_53_5]OLE74165.1 MAG: hypothetical protein AUG19_09600 [archaeon 13_1_20CM_2_54_9]